MIHVHPFQALSLTLTTPATRKANRGVKPFRSSISDPCASPTNDPLPISFSTLSFESKKPTPIPIHRKPHHPLCFSSPPRGRALLHPTKPSSSSPPFSHPTNPSQPLQNFPPNPLGRPIALHTQPHHPGNRTPLQPAAAGGIPYCILPCVLPVLTTGPSTITTSTSTTTTTDPLLQRREVLPNHHHLRTTTIPSSTSGRSRSGSIQAIRRPRARETGGGIDGAEGEEAQFRLRLRRCRWRVLFR
ncbi:hypothetical protein KC357_g209 [Hortaea werneckii]|nr:hypothetical protein KC357_g209 [Hortaea werneckii]